MTDREMLEEILSKLDKQNKRFNKIEEKLERLETEVDLIKETQREMKSDISEIKYDQREIRLTLENEIRGSINIIGERRRDLTRNLQEVGSANADYVALKLKYLALNTDIRELKRTVSKLEQKIS